MSAATLFRDGLHQIIDDTDDLRVVALAGGPADLLRMLAIADPDVVVYHAVGRHPAHCTELRTMMSDDPQVGVVILVPAASPASLTAPPVTHPGTGALWLSTTSSSTRFVTAIRTACGRSGYLGAGAEPPENTLSPREAEVIELVAMAYTNGQIARQLHISENTVKRHLRSIFRKLDAVSRIDAVNRAKVFSTRTR